MFRGHNYKVKNQYVYDVNCKQSIFINLKAIKLNNIPESIHQYINRQYFAETGKPSVDLWNYMIDHETDITNINWGADDTLASMYESMMFSDKKSKYIPREVLHEVIYKQE